MIAILGFASIVLLAMLMFPQIAFARLCHRELVERPAAALAKFRRHHLLYAIILIPIMMSEGEFVAIMGPEFLAAYAMEMAVYFDAVIFTLVASAHTHLKAVGARIGACFRKVPSRPRTKRAPRQPQRLRGPANDDEEGPAPALAA